MVVAGAANLLEIQKSVFPRLNRFALKDRERFQTYIDRFSPVFCEYNFSNLYAWQDVYKMGWTVYQERLLIYDGVSQAVFMPLGHEFYPEELVVFSLNLKAAGFTPDISLVTPDYLKKFPDVENYYTIREERDYAEYIYDVEDLRDLNGIKLHKKRNLISQFKRYHPDFEVHLLKGKYQHKSLDLAKKLLKRKKRKLIALDQEFCALTTAFDHFEQLGLEGLVVTIGENVVAFSVFSRLNPFTYDIQFEKSDMDYKGAAQLINQETARYLVDKCHYLNREQDLGIKGLRQAKMSYDPEQLITPRTLIFSPPN